MSESTTINESDILDEIVASTEAARSILELRFSDRATGQMRELLERNNEGMLTPEEQDVLEKC